MTKFVSKVKSIACVIDHRHTKTRFAGEYAIKGNKKINGRETFGKTRARIIRFEMWKSPGNGRTVLRMVLKKRLYFTGYKFRLMYVFRTDDNRRNVTFLRMSSILSIMPIILTVCTIHLGHISHVRPCSKTHLEQPHAFVEHSPYNPTLRCVFDLHIAER
jgi:hypothetical protein